MTQYQNVFPLISATAFFFLFVLGYLFTKFFAKTRPKGYNKLWLVLLVQSILILGLLFPLTRIITEVNYLLVYSPFIMLVFTIYFLYKFITSIKK